MFFFPSNVIFPPGDLFFPFPQGKFPHACHNLACWFFGWPNVLLAPVAAF